jgi:hypothetical protein
MNQRKEDREHSFKKLHYNFEGIISIIKEINLSKIILSEKNIEFRTMYTELVKTNNTKIFLFCLDSLYLQYKSLMMDLESFENNRKFIMNRMYCDYYKLYHLIISEVNEKNIFTIESKTYPPYKNLEILYEYNIDTIINIHSDILDILYKIYEKIRINDSSLQNHIDTNSVLYISNFLNTLKYENGLLDNHLMLYINYVSFFHFSQKKMLVKLYSKMSDFNRDIDEYMGFNRIISIDDIHTMYSDSGESFDADYSTDNENDISSDIDPIVTTHINNISDISNINTLTSLNNASDILDFSNIYLDKNSELKNEQLYIDSSNIVISSNISSNINNILQTDLESLSGNPYNNHMFMNSELINDKVVEIVEDNEERIIIGNVEPEDNDVQIYLEELLQVNFENRSDSK